MSSINQHVVDPTLYACSSVYSALKYDYGFDDLYSACLVLCIDEKLN
jgi:hypothetical protein